jgi:D-alanyl-D-alanine carboxypeptidase
MAALTLPASAAAETKNEPIIISAKAAIVTDADSGTTLFAKNADEQMKIASTTKILTALIAIERCDPDETVVIKREWTGIEGSSMYLVPGERLTVRDLLYGVLLVSGNDAAVALACHTAGSVREFARLMNRRATELGCENSGFANPNGLDEDGHYSTARDLAVITAAAMSNATFAEIAGTKETSAAGRAFRNHNRLLWELPGALGVKTGFTKSSGRSLVSCVRRGDFTLICVTLNDPNDWADHTALYNWAFEAHTRVTIRRGEEIGALIPVISGVKPIVRLAAGAERTFIYRRGGNYDVSVNAPPFAYAVVVKGARAGELVIKRDGTDAARVPLMYAETVRRNETEKLTFWEKIKRAWYAANKYGAYRRMYYW